MTQHVATCPAAGCSSAAPRSAPARCSPPAPATSTADQRPDQGRRHRRQPERRARQEGHHRLLRAGRRPRLDRRHHQQRQGAGRRRTRDVEFKTVEAGADAAAQRAALSTLIAQKPDVIVLLPHDGKELNAFGLEAMKAGIPVVNLDRAFPDPPAYRLQIKGDNYGMGVAAGQLHRRAAQGQGRHQPDHRRDRRHRLPGADPGAVEGLQGRAGRVRLQGRPTGGRREFTADSGQQEAANLLQALPKIDALWNHDDDQGIGVLAAINAGQPQGVLHGRRRRLARRRWRTSRPTTRC